MFIGEFFVVGINIEPYNPKTPDKYLKDLFGLTVEPSLLECYKNYLVIVPSPAQEFEQFSRKVNEYLKKPPFNFGNPLASLGKEKKVSIGTYYILFIFSIAINIMESSVPVLTDLVHNFC